MNWSYKSHLSPHAGLIQILPPSFGHGYTERTLLVDQDLAVERALWAALRTLEERVNMLEAMARREAEAGRTSSARGYEEWVAESRGHI